MALWLSSTEFGTDVEKEEESSASSKSPPLSQGASVSVKESVEDRMHLILGKYKNIFEYSFDLFISSSNFSIFRHY